MTPHIEAEIGQISQTVLMPGDPKRAKFIADNYLTDVKLVSNIRGISAYTGFYKNKEITIMASGMGMPSIGIYSYELYKFYNVENIIRIGSAGSYTKQLDLYSLVLVTSSYTKSSYAKVQGYNSDTIMSSEYLNNVIKSTCKDLNKDIVSGKVFSSDVFYTEESIDDYNNMYNNNDCLCTEMESFALFYNAKKFNKRAACILTISDNLITGKQTSSIDRQNSFTSMIEVALESTLKL